MREEEGLAVSSILYLYRQRTCLNDEDGRCGGDTTHTTSSSPARFPCFKHYNFQRGGGIRARSIVFKNMIGNASSCDSAADDYNVCCFGQVAG